VSEHLVPFVSENEASCRVVKSETPSTSRLRFNRNKINGAREQIAFVTSKPSCLPTVKSATVKQLLAERQRSARSDAESTISQDAVDPAINPTATD
jgi:hypothetical protein